MSIIDKTILFVKTKLEQAEGGHDWFHIERVYKNALLIAQEETLSWLGNNRDVDNVRQRKRTRRR